MFLFLRAPLSLKSGRGHLFLPTQHLSSIEITNREWKPVGSLRRMEHEKARWLSVSVFRKHPLCICARHFYLLICTPNRIIYVTYIYAHVLTVQSNKTKSQICSLLLRSCKIILVLFLHATI